MALKGVASETLHICEAGEYVGPSGATVRFDDVQRAAEAGVQLYTPDALATLLTADGPGGSAPTMRVTVETSQLAAHRLYEAGHRDILVLNYASARNPGGGFLNGAKAQEEDVCRCSGLYPTLIRAMEYYTVNRAQSSMLYTDHLIFSPNVPFFRTKSRNLCDSIYVASVITAPAPNAGQALRRNPNAGREIDATLTRRAGMVLAAAADQGCRTLVLGAWGCGVFRNDPRRMAEIWREWLTSPRFAGCFDTVVFGLTKRPPANLEAFSTVFGPTAPDAA